MAHAVFSPGILRWLCSTICVTSLTLTMPVQAASVKGQLEWRNIVEIRAGVSGRLEQLPLVAGMEFSKDTVLSTIDESTYKAVLSQVTHRYQLSKDELDDAEKKFEREQILFDEGSLALVEFDRERLALERARAHNKAAEIDFLKAQNRANLARIEAPFDGVVLNVVGRHGEYVNAVDDAPVIARIAERDKYSAIIEIDPQVRRSLQIGGDARVISGSESIAARIGLIGYHELANDQSWRVGVFFDSDNEWWVPGMEVEVELP
ncbi:MAG: hypothetical protein DHS20C01_24950 [marine bacterium B5-7]|nr:MAG: hypothetical protein DHS20C01_24950 [marine bacterium B5-7]